MAYKGPCPKEGRDRDRKCSLRWNKWSTCQPKTEMGNVLLSPFCGETGVVLVLLIMTLFLFQYWRKTQHLNGIYVFNKHVYKSYCVLFQVYF